VATGSTRGAIGRRSSVPPRSTSRSPCRWATAVRASHSPMTNPRAPANRAPLAHTRGETPGDPVAGRRLALPRWACPSAARSCHSPASGTNFSTLPLMQ
jgi:hypothetical protein